ncbi:MAG TPA: hypothetical protein VEP49_20845 [Acidimicrobiia bacterium]|nr:hypothetical protein [Acidimicrobiia bacterium]
MASARDLIEDRLEPGEPIEAFLRLAASGPAPDSRAGGVLTVAGALTLSGPAVRHMVRSTTIAVTDRRVFFVGRPVPHGVRVEPKRSVRVLAYDTTGEWIRLWLNIDGQQSGYVIGRGLRAATDAVVHALGGAPPSLTRTNE